MMRVFVTHNPEDRDAYFGRALPLLEAVPGVDVSLNGTDGNLDTEQLIEAAAGHQVIIAHRSTPGPAELFARTPDLVAMLRTAIDISTIDVDAASANGVLVANADKSFIASTAELAVGLLLDCARNISASVVDYRNGTEPPQRAGRQLRGTVVGLIGYGAIGRYLADLLRALGADVVVCDPFTDPAADGFDTASMDQLLATAEVIIPLTPGGDEGRGLIDRAALASVGPGAMLINVSRGEVLDDDAVLEALDDGRLAAVGIDVGNGPDQRPSERLAGHPAVVATPHLGGLTPANADAQAASAVDQVAAIIAGEMPPRAVNPDHATRLRHLWAAR